MVFKASMGKEVKIVTMAVTMLFVGLAVWQASIVINGGRTTFILPIILLMVIYFGAYLFRPVQYELNENMLIIHRPLNDVKIVSSNIKSIEQVNSDKLSWAIRVFGVGGLFGYWGKFANRQIGNMTWYATRKNNAVLIRTYDDKKIVITPDEPEKLINAFRN